MLIKTEHVSTMAVNGDSDRKAPMHFCILLLTLCVVENE